MKRFSVKTVVLIALFLIAVSILWRLNGTKKYPLTFSGRTLYLNSGTCTMEFPSIDSEEELVDDLDISRHLIKLPNGTQLYYESVDLPATYDFSLPPDALVAKIFRFVNFGVDKETGHIFLVRGEDGEGRSFRVLVLTESSHRLEMVYPLDEETANIFAECLVNGLKNEFPEPSAPATPDRDIKPDWSESEIVKQNMIEKDM